jgi:hypothetical protein
MAKTRVLQSTTQTQMRDWEAEIKALKVKLHSARPLDKIQYYEEIKALQAKWTAARNKSIAGRDRQEGH